MRLPRHYIKQILSWLYAPLLAMTRYRFIEYLTPSLRARNERGNLIFLHLIKRTLRLSTFFVEIIFSVTSFAQSSVNAVPQSKMKEIYEAVKTPYKYGLAVVPSDNEKKIDCPSVFRDHGAWYMTYIQFTGRGYETWLAESADLLHWQTKGKVMRFSDDTTQWDCNQKAGYVALETYDWGGKYQWQKYDGKYWMSYFGGPTRGYEKNPLSLGIAYSTQDPSVVHEWNRLSKPVLTTKDADVSWWDNHTQYKSTVIWDKQKTLGYSFIMYYNANGDSISKTRGAERIGMAVSNDMLHWKRYGKDPVLDHHSGITGDPMITKMGNIYVMFYFGAFWNHSGEVFNRFACSYDLVHWTDWNGKPLITASEPYDNMFAHKSYVVKWKGVVYHFYCAVNKAGQRGIAIATSKDLGRSSLNFVVPPAKKKK